MEDKPVTEKMQKAQMMLNELEIRRLKRQSATFVGADLDLLIMLLRRVVYIVLLVCLGCNLFAQNYGVIGQPGPTLTPVGDSMGLSIPFGELVHGTGTKLPGSSDSLVWNAGLSVTGRITLNSLLSDPLDSLLYVDTLNRVGKIHKNDLGVGGTPSGSNKEIQFNNSGAFGADTLFVFDSSTDQLGIGTASPSVAKIHIHVPTAGGASTIRYTNSTTGSGVTDGFYTGYGDNAYFVNYENTPITFWTNSLERFSISAAGKLKADAYTGTTFDDTPSKYLGLNSSQEVITFSAPAGADGLGKAFGSGALIIGTGTTAGKTDSLNLFWDDANNRLGIGTITPATALDVSGQITSTTTAKYAYTANSSHATPRIAINATTGTNVGVEYQVAGSTIWFLGGYDAIAGGNLEWSLYNNQSGAVGTAFTVNGANNSIAIGTTSPAASAILDVSSTTKGLKIPTMTTTQRDAISSPAAGLIIYNTTTTKLEVYNGAWTAVH